MRSFTIVDFPKNGETYGRYLANTPKGAANKAFSTLSRIIDLKYTNHKNLMVFTIRETTRNNNNNYKEYKYVGTRVELVEPHKVKRGNKNIEYRFRNIITPYDNYIV